MKQACVIGWPISQSRSPLIHGYWLRRYGIDGSYAKEAVTPEDLATFLKSLAERGFAGCNVTVPHKERAYALADHREPSAVAVGAANTLWLDGKRLCAANTDGTGFMAHLSAQIPDWARRDAPVSILGAGGAARALIHAFLSAGVSEIRLFNRTMSRAEDLANRFGRYDGARVKVYDWERRAEKSRNAGVMVNTTSLGMAGKGSLEMDLTRFNAETIIADIVYVPLETELLRQARERGLRRLDGLGMLLYQAVPGFEKWFGVRPEVTSELHDMIVADIEGR